jgi:hypothetical protein
VGRGTPGRAPSRGWGVAHLAEHQVAGGAWHTWHQVAGGAWHTWQSTKSRVGRGTPGRAPSRGWGVAHLAEHQVAGGAWHTWQSTKSPAQLSAAAAAVMRSGLAESLTPMDAALHTMATSCSGMARARMRTYVAAASTSGPCMPSSDSSCNP